MAKMRITLVSPPNTLNRDAGKAHLVEPLGLAYIAAVLEEKGYSPVIIDADTLGYSVEETVQHIRETKPDIVGFSCQTPLYPIALEIAEALKKDLKILTVVGGVHATAFPNIVVEEAVDFAICGEGEFAFALLVKALETKGSLEIAGVCYKDKGKMVCTPAERIADLDKLPFPARHLLPMEKYNYSFPVATAQHMVYASVNFSRGCPYGCIFCNSPQQWKRRVTHRSAENIIGELKELKEKFGVNTFYVRDEVFTLNKKNAMRICELMVKEKLDMSWFCYARADHLTEGLLRAMKRAGCRLVKIGVETGDPDIMKKIKKGETLRTIEKGFQLAHKVGMYTHASFMIGHPWDSEESVHKSIEFAKKLNADTVAFPIMMPFPGTEVWEIAEQEHLLLTKEYEKFNVIGSSVMRTKYLEPEDLVRLQRKALREYYFRPGYFKKAASRILADPISIRMYIQPAMILFKWMKKR